MELKSWELCELPTLKEKYRAKQVKIFMVRLLRQSTHFSPEFFFFFLLSSAILSCLDHKRDFFGQCLWLLHVCCVSKNSIASASMPMLLSVMAHLHLRVEGGDQRKRNPKRVGLRILSTSKSGWSIHGVRKKFKALSLTCFLFSLGCHLAWFSYLWKPPVGASMVPGEKDQGESLLNLPESRLVSWDSGSRINTEPNNKVWVPA